MRNMRGDQAYCSLREPPAACKAYFAMLARHVVWGRLRNSEEADSSQYMRHIQAAENRANTYGGGGGDDKRRRWRAFGLPLGSDEFLWARNCIDGRRGSSGSMCGRTGSCRGLTV
jgi:hypothetical protein